MVDGSLIVKSPQIPSKWRAPDSSYSKAPEYYSRSINSQSFLNIKQSIIDLKDELGRPIDIINNPIIETNSEKRNRFLKLRSNYIYEYSKKFDNLRLSSNYTDLLNSVGYHFNINAYPGNIYEKILSLSKEKPTGSSLYSSFWYTERLKEMGLSELGLTSNDRLIGNLKFVSGDLYFSTTDNYPDSTFGKFFKLTPEGSLSQLYRTPGRLLFALANPNNTDKLLISADGFPESDKRFQSLFEYDRLTNNWQVINFPGDSRGGRPELYAGGGFFDKNGDIIFKRYGFVDEGGGLWFMNLRDYSQIKYLIPGDHILSLTNFNKYLSSKFPSGVFDEPHDSALALTLKEVSDNFAMTFNRSSLSYSGMETRIDNITRITKMVGWNPVIAYSNEFSPNAFDVYSAINYNYEGCIENKPMGVYYARIQSSGGISPTLSPTVTQAPTSTVDDFTVWYGSVLAQGRTNQVGPAVFRIYKEGQPSPAISKDIWINANGTYRVEMRFSDMDPGIYHAFLKIQRAGYLVSSKRILWWNFNRGKEFEANFGTLVAGDINGDNNINIQDLSIVGNHYSKAKSDDPIAWAEGIYRADINNSEKVDIGDLTLVGNNFNRRRDINIEE